MNQPISPSPIINVEGDLIITHSLSLFDTAPAEPPAREQATTAAPAVIIRDDAIPWKIFADGQRLDAREPATDHVALLFPDTHWMVGVATLCQSDKNAFDSQQEAESAAKALALLGYDDWLLASDKVYDRHVIDRRYHEPAADKNLYPNLLLTDTYWTSTITPWSQAHAFGVGLDFGYVSYFHRGSSGFGLAARRARQ